MKRLIDRYNFWLDKLHLVIDLQGIWVDDHKAPYIYRIICKCKIERYRELRAFIDKRIKQVEYEMLLKLLEDQLIDTTQWGKIRQYKNFDFCVEGREDDNTLYYEATIGGQYEIPR